MIKEQYRLEQSLSLESPSEDELTQFIIIDLRVPFPALNSKIMIKKHYLPFSQYHVLPVGVICRLLYKWSILYIILYNFWFCSHLNSVYAMNQGNLNFDVNFTSYYQFCMSPIYRSLPCRLALKHPLYLWMCLSLTSSLLLLVTSPIVTNYPLVICFASGIRFI